ncbi:MAG: pirin family protein [Gammaproteobacteria bacterium]|nr:pirin family protein [Gammaproteobacteria bacterium]
MFELRRAQDRGHSRHDGLDSHHSFSFADYYHPERMGFSVLRVINDDEVAPGAGFPTHGHRDMEIISYVLQGSIEHRDSMNHVSRLEAGEAQRMSAGTGVRHSEYNASQNEPLRFLQIWIEPDQRGISPGYEQRSVARDASGPNLELLASGDARNGSMRIQQNVDLYVGRLGIGESLEYAVAEGRRVYVHVVSGTVNIGDFSLEGGDALTVEQEPQFVVQSTEGGEFLLFDLP